MITLDDVTARIAALEEQIRAQRRGRPRRTTPFAVLFLARSLRCRGIRHQLAVDLLAAVAAAHDGRIQASAAAIGCSRRTLQAWCDRWPDVAVLFHRHRKTSG